MTRNQIKQTSLLIIILFIISVASVHAIAGVLTNPDDDNQCQNLYWFDNNNKECGLKMFCGQYMYLGLNTFTEKDVCLYFAHETQCPTQIMCQEGYAGCTGEDGCPTCCKLGSLYGSFSNYGLYKYDGITWLPINSVNPDIMTTSGGILYADFANYGLYKYAGGAWTEINKVHPTNMLSSDGKLYATFAGYGFYQYDGTNWIPINTVNPDKMTTSGGILYADFANYGLYKYAGGAWTEINKVHPSNMLSSDGKLYATFAGYGFYQYDGNTWLPINSVNPEKMTVSGGLLYADFANYGLYKYVGGVWTEINKVRPTNMLSFDGKLYAAFTGYGLYQYENATGWRHINSVNPESMTISDGILYSVFKDYGFYKYDGNNWSQINSVNPARIATATNAPTTTASPIGNTFVNGLSVRLSANEPAVIYYTTDGSSPDKNSIVYDETKPIQIADNTILKFFAVNFSGNAEEVKTETYAINLAPTTISGLPTGLSNSAVYSINIGGTGVIAYKYRLDQDSWSAETSIDEAISLTGLIPGVHTLYVIGKDRNGQWQAEDKASTAVWQQEKTNTIISTNGNINGEILGLTPGDKATVILGSDIYLKSTLSQDDGTFSFSEIPNGRYFLKIEINGYSTEAARDAIVARNGLYSSVMTIDAPTKFVAAKIDSSIFSYHWEQDVSRSGYQQSAYINKKQQIIFLNETLEVIDLAAAEKLQHDYNIVLSNEGAPWNQEYAYRLLEIMKSIPQVLRNSYQFQTLAPSKWILTNNYIADDISIQKFETGNIITLSTAAFVYATPRLVLIEGLKGTFFSKRLHHALVRYVTDEGQNIQAVEKILKDRYGCTTVIPDYTALTAPTTQEDSNRFQNFHPHELVEIINIFEEMPKGYHVVKGLKYLVRRKDGMPHPLYPEAPAVGWPTAHAESYIEFMDTAFLSDFDHMHRLILHEKSHFMWANLFTQNIKNDWITVGGWYENPNDPDGWSTTKTTEFVSAYAHKKNPDEDMAESISYFVLNPDMLRSRSMPKYEFVRDRIMNGNLYISKIREDLTFEVLNLFPDYNYPGKIKRVDIRVEGLPEEDKTVTVEIELNIIDRIFDGAKYAYARVLSEIGTFADFYMLPVNTNGSILRGSFSISKYSKGGLWFTDQIVVTDQVGNQRFEGVTDFGWKLFVNSPLEDTIKPKYVPHSLALQLSNPEVLNGHEVQKLTVTWQVDENKEMRSSWPVYAYVTNPESGAYRQEDYGTYDPVTKTARIIFNITEYFAPGNYGVPYIAMIDQAKNHGDQRFSDSPNDETLISVYINPRNPDIIPPEIDLNRITVTATPVNPTAPDGETLVKIVYYARDEKSGLGLVNYRLLDPQGISHFQYHYHENFYTMFFQGDPTEWKRYEINVVLPQGSPPGVWGLQEMEVYDKAKNRKSYNFLETLHFEILSPQ